MVASAVAAGAWTNGTDNLIVVLIATPKSLPDGKKQARTAVLSLCASATSNPPTSVGPFRGIDRASEAECSGKNAAGVDISGAAVAWPKKNVFALVGGAGVSLERAEALSAAQDDAIPAGVRVTRGGTAGLSALQVVESGRAVK